MEEISLRSLQKFFTEEKAEKKVGGENQWLLQRVQRKKLKEISGITATLWIYTILLGTFEQPTRPRVFPLEWRESFQGG